MLKSLVRPKPWFFAALTALSSFASLAQAAHEETLTGRHVRISWLAPKAFGTGPSTVGLVFQPDPGWHVYWKNPGDSGIAPKFHLVSEQSDIGTVQWPHPSRIQYGPLVNFGYLGEAGFLFSLTPKTSASIEIEARLEWLVCQEECIPGRGGIWLKRPRDAKVESEWSASDLVQLTHLQSFIPKSGLSAQWQIPRATFDRTSVHVRVVTQDKSPSVDEHRPEFFPTDGQLISSVEPKAAPIEGGFELTFPRTNAQETPASTGFVAVDQTGSAWEWAAVSLVPISAQSVTLSELFILFVSAVLGGVILNLMPCVLPVLSIKIMSLARTNHSRVERVRESVLYALGVVVTFTALGAALLIIRSAGVAVGWGFHLQSPIVVTFLLLLFWLMALNFLGVFEMGSSFMSWAGRHGDTSSFATGILSVAVAAPCTGPFMGSALGAAAVLPALEGLSLFFGLGLGLSAPVLVLAIKPSLLKKLPKPGAWMEKLRQFFAFPLFATVLWLLWVLAAQTGSAGWLIGSALLLTTSFSLWLGKAGQSRSVRIAAWVISLLAISLALPKLVAVANSPSIDRAAMTWTKFSEDAVSAAQARHQPVFIDFTASWCITCQLNRRAVLESDAAIEIFQRHHVLLLEADWTKQDFAITSALAGFGRNSVPLYVYYSSQVSQPIILPQILTISDIQNLFNLKESAK